MKKIDNDIMELAQNTQYSESSFALEVYYLLQEYYLATFSIENSRIEIDFQNGQKFTVTIEDQSKRQLH